jgi:hypothetical protein
MIHEITRRSLHFRPGVFRFRDRGDELDEERVVKSATGIRNTVAWKKLFKFQRDGGLSGDLDLAHVNWGNYDLVVIDESHNFRNKRTPRQGGETRYDRLMRKIIKEGVKTRVLMLSATPVNNRMADLRNQIAFATEGDDTALLNHGIKSIDSTTRLAQKQFNRWLDLIDSERTPSRLIEMLGFDYFTLLDLLTIARSRKHIEKYYGIAETGRFPDRLKPINIKADVDLTGAFPPIADINLEIRKLNLSAYAPLRYVLEHKKQTYDKKYSTEVKGGTGFFRQVDRKESLIHLLRVNVLKRMESSVISFALTVERQLRDVEATLARIENQVEELEEIDIEDVDLIRWKQKLIEDRNRLANLHAPGNRKVIVFTAFADNVARRTWPPFWNRTASPTCAACRSQYKWTKRKTQAQGN